MKSRLHRSVLFAVALALPLAAAAQWLPSHAPLPVWGGAVFYGYGGPWIGGYCGGYGCGMSLDFRTQLRRELRFQELREGGARATDSAYPMSPHDLRPPTPVSDIQPAYRDASQIRPEFRRSGDPPGP